MPRKKKGPSKERILIDSIVLPSESMSENEYFEILKQFMKEQWKLVGTLTGNHQMLLNPKNSKTSKHYMSGKFTSKKSPFPIMFRSGWEKIVCGFFDTSDEVLCYVYEPFYIVYGYSTTKTKKVSVKKYYPDFLVLMKDGSVRIIEVKREDKLKDRKVVAKARAAREWSENQNIKYTIWTLEQIKMCRALLLDKTKTVSGSLDLISVPQP